jgi:hypothetical protein
MLARSAAVVLAGVACSSEETPVQRGGSLQVEWVGADTGKLSAPAVAEWCDSLRMLELRAISGDTGVVLALYPSVSVTTGIAIRPADYRVVEPQRADSIRPSAAIVLRYFAETSIRGFRSDSGTVALKALGSRAGAGRFSAHLRSATDGSRLTVTGSFDGLAVTTAPAACGGEPDEPELPTEEEDEDYDGGGADTE